MSQQPSWFDDQPYAIGDRVRIHDQAAQEQAGSDAGRVVGYDASGPRPGEAFIRILIMPDAPTPSIVALSPHAIAAEGQAADAGLARTLLVEMEQNLAPELFSKVLTWLRSDVCAQIIARPDTARKQIRLGTITLPGFVLPALAQIAAERQKDAPAGE